MFLLAVLSCISLAYASLPIEVHHHAQPYKFGYSVKDHHGEQHREESGNGAGAVAGSYGFTDDRGIARQVNYVADHAGFRAQVKTNEPGTANQDPAAVKVISNAPYAHGAALSYNSGPLLNQAGPVLGLNAGYGLGYGGYGLGYGGYGLGYEGYGAGNGGYGAGNGGYGYGGALGYTGLLGGYGGINYGAPLVGGAVSGYDSRFANLIA